MLIATGALLLLFAGVVVVALGRSASESRDRWCIEEQMAAVTL